MDGTTSNYATDPATSTPQRVESDTLPAGGPVTPTFTLGPNAMSLVVLTSVP